jgi:hypothetical protein
MDLPRFAQFHLPALEADEIRFNVQVAVLRAAAEESTPGFSYWTVGGPGHCAIKSPGRAILLCALERSECEELGRNLQDLDYPGVAGADQTVHWFVEQATKLGLTFEDPIPQRIHILASAPHYPAAPGSPRKADISDVPLLLEWLEAFRSEAVPHDPPPEKASIEKSVASGRFFFWTNNGRPVSVAAISRRLRHAAAVAPVYTPPEERSRG